MGCDVWEGTWWQGQDTVAGWDVVPLVVWDVRTRTWWQRDQRITYGVAGMGHQGWDMVVGQDVVAGPWQAG